MWLSYGQEFGVLFFWLRVYIYNTNTCLTAFFPGLPGWAGTRKVKPIWILLKKETVSGSGISWAICKSAPRSRQMCVCQHPTNHAWIVTLRRAQLLLDWWPSSGGCTISVCNQSTRSTQPCICPASLNRLLASVGVRKQMSKCHFCRLAGNTMCNQSTRSTQPCISPASLNRVSASVGVRTQMSPLPGGR